MNYNMNLIGTRKYPIIAYYTKAQKIIKRSKSGSDEITIIIINGYLCAQDSFYMTHQQKQRAAVDFSWAQALCTVPHRPSQTWVGSQECWAVVLQIKRGEISLGYTTS
jgi:hypothetical protein